MMFYWMVIVLISSLCCFGTSVHKRYVIYMYRKQINKNYVDPEIEESEYLLNILIMLVKYIIQVINVAYFVHNDIGGYVTYAYAIWLILLQLKDSLGSKLFSKEEYAKNRIEKLEHEYPYAFANSVDLLYILYILYVLK